MLGVIADYTYVLKTSLVANLPIQLVWSFSQTYLSFLIVENLDLKTQQKKFPFSFESSPRLQVVLQHLDMKQFIQNHGLIHQTTCWDTPQQNEVVEKKKKKNPSLSLMYQLEVFNKVSRGRTGQFYYQSGRVMEK